LSRYSLKTKAYSLAGEEKDRQGKGKKKKQDFLRVHALIFGYVSPYLNPNSENIGNTAADTEKSSSIRGG